MSIGPIVTGGFGKYAGAFAAVVVTGGYYPGFAAPPAPAIGGIPIKRKRQRYEIEINGQRFIASSVPTLEAMVAQWRKAHPANDKPTIVTAKPKLRKEVVPNTRAIDALPSGRDTATPPATERAPGAVAVQLGPIQSELALGQQSAIAHAAFAELAARAQIEALERQLAEEAARRQAEEDDDMEAIMAILQAVA